MSSSKRPRSDGCEREPEFYSGKRLWKTENQGHQQDETFPNFLDTQQDTFPFTENLSISADIFASLWQDGDASNPGLGWEHALSPIERDSGNSDSLAPWKYQSDTLGSFIIPLSDTERGITDPRRELATGHVCFGTVGQY